MSYEGVYKQLIENLQVLDARLTLAGKRVGLNPFETHYDLVTDEQMRDNLTYVAMPVHYRHWRYGKAAQRDRSGGSAGHVFEVVINSDPSVCYLGLTNDLVMMLLVMAHAKWGHVDMDANNCNFRPTRSNSIVEQFAQNKKFVDRLIDNPDFGWDFVEMYLDAAHALEYHTGDPNHEAPVPDKEHFQQLLDELRSKETEYTLAIAKSDKDLLKKDLEEIQRRLKCHPIMPSSDVLGFLADAENTPHLSDEARALISIVREQSRYFRPQMETKFMHEGWASYWHEHLLKAPEVDLIGIGFAQRFDAAKYWMMHDYVPADKYFNPYALGVRVWKYIDNKYGYDEGTEKIRYKGLKLEDGSVIETKKWKTREVVKRNRDKMFEVRRQYNDARFLDEYLNEELFEQMNMESLNWMRTQMEQINKMLRERGWGENVIFDPIPETLEGMGQIVQTWTNLAQQSVWYRQRMGVPMFPVSEHTLQQMATILQIVGAYDEDRHKTRRQLVLRTGTHSLPNIKIVDTGRRNGSNTWTLRHEYDPNFGPLLQSEARETLRYFRLLCGGPCRLLTMEQRSDYYGRPYGDPVPYEYFTEDGDEVKEQFL